MKLTTILFPLMIVLFGWVLVNPVSAVMDPLSVPNNKFGIHLISPTTQEASSAAALVNTSGGDWGYVTVLIEDNDLNKSDWQNFFDELRRRHLIPIVRLATQADGDFWKLPTDQEAETWANFLDSLNWPTKNRYVIVYNEPNHAQEWGNSVDAKSYAQVLDKTITALKNKNPDFFVLNAGLDASAPEKQPAYEDELNFLKDMNDAVPGIFDKLDGWVSHSYPNPNFSGSPDDTGRGTVRTYQWELSILKNLGVSKNLPVFITETGWQHAEGLTYDPSLPTSDQVGKDFQDAFSNAWNNPQIVAVTPFLLNYQETPFDHFSFRKPDGETDKVKILGTQYPNSPFYSQYQAISSINKLAGQPVQDNQGELISGSIFSSLVLNQKYTVPLTFKNTGQSIWGDTGSLVLMPTQDSPDLGIPPVTMPSNRKIEPGQTYAFNVPINPTQVGSYKMTFELLNNSQPVSVGTVEFNIEVKTPVILVVKSKLDWKQDFSGTYFLTAISQAGQALKQIILGNNGESQPVEIPQLLPDYTYNFTLSRPYYASKTIQQKVSSGVNTLDFGYLHPDISTAIFSPPDLWKLLPFSNQQ